MLIRICLIVALLTGLAVGILNFVSVRDKITTLQVNLKEQTDGRIAAETARDKFHRDLDKTTTELTETKQNLETTTAQRDTAVKQAADQTKRADQLASDLETTKKAKDDAQASLQAYTLTGFTPEQILALGKSLKRSQDDMAAQQDENKLLGQKISKLSNELAFYRNPQRPIPLPAGLFGKVLVTDPKWDFVVLNVGEEQGIVAHSELLVNRDGKLVAKVKITSVQKNRCIANVMPGWKLGEVLEGDQVIPAYPAS